MDADLPDNTNPTYDEGIHIVAIRELWCRRLDGGKSMVRASLEPWQLEIHQALIPKRVGVNRWRPLGTLGAPIALPFFAEDVD